MPAKGKGKWIKAPKIKTLQSDDGVLSKGFLTRDDTLTISGTGQPGSRIVLFDNGKKIGTATVDDDGKWSIDTGRLGDGAHKFTARAKFEGLAGKKSKAFKGEVDATPPAAPVKPDLATASDTGASSADDHTADDTPTLTGAAEAGATVTIRNGAVVLGTAVADDSGQWTFTTGALAEGGHSFTAIATDKAGNTGAPSAALVITIDKTITASITLNPVTEDNIINLTEGDPDCAGDIPISGTVSGEIPDGATVTLVVNGVTYTGTVTAGAFTIMVRPADLTDDADLTISASVTALDAAGNTAVVTDTQTYTLDTHIPDEPEITGWSEDTDTAGDLITRDNDLTLTGTAEAGITVVFFREDRSNPLGSTVADENGDWVFQTGELPIGRWRLYAEAVSEGGNGSGADSIRIAITGNLVYDAGFLTAALGFVIEGAEDMDRLGFSVSGAGDVNGDGFDDMIVGAFSASDGGEAYVIFGKASGFGTVDGVTGRATLGVGDLAPANGFVIQGAADGDHAGFSVSGAGDVNGDGFDDLIVGAQYAAYPDGTAYVVFGKASGFGTVDGVTGRAVIDLGSLASPAGFVITGDSESFAGFSVSGAGDVNGDGFDDLLVGAPAFGVYPNPHGLGKAYVIFGKASGFGPIDLSTLGSAGFVIEGAAESDVTGYAVSGAGDLNDDGFADIVIGARFSDAGGERAGEAFVVFGKASGFGTVDLATLAPAAGFVIRGEETTDRLGDSVSGAGDINGDGFHDLIIGATFGDDGGNYAGEAYVIYGKATGFGTVDGSGRAIVDVTDLDPTVGFVIQGGGERENLGKSVSSAGDVNGDGYDDLLIGAYSSDDGASNGGEAYVVFGKAGGFGELDEATGRMVVDLRTMGPEDGFAIWGDRFDDVAGQSVSNAGDINGDGFDDLMVGAPGAGDGEYDFGHAYVMYGSDFRDEIDHLGDADANTLTGTSAAETFVGGRGADTLIGNGGADSFRGGAGNDTIDVIDFAFLRVDGGSGSDTLRLGAEDSLTLDFSVISSSRVRSIEAIQFATGGNDTLKLTALDVLTMSDNVSGGLTTLTVIGGTGDSFATNDSGWTNLGGDANNITLAKGNVRIIVDTDIDISGVLLAA